MYTYNVAAFAQDFNDRTRVYRSLNVHYEYSGFTLVAKSPGIRKVSTALTSECSLLLGNSGYKEVIG